MEPDIAFCLFPFLSQKRNHLIERLGKHLKNNSKKLAGSSIQLQCSGGGGSGAPYLRLVPRFQKHAKFQVHLYVGMESIEWIPPIRLVPNRSNIKTKMDQHNDLESSQWYNHWLLHDARHIFQDDHLSSLQEYATLVSSTLVLVQVWGLQRGLWRNHDGWTLENVALLLSYLFRTNKVNPRMTTIQLLTVVFQTWATTDWLGERETTVHSSSEKRVQTQTTVRAAHTQSHHDVPTSTTTRRTILVLPLEGLSEKDTIQQSPLAKLYAKQTKESPLTDHDPPSLVDAYANVNAYQLGPVFLDPTMTFNYLGHVSPNYMKLLQSHARKSLDQIHTRQAFSYLFMKPARFWSQWDLYVRIPISGDSTDDWELSTRKFVQTLERALGNRVRGLRVLSTGNGELDEDSDEIPSIEVQKEANHTTQILSRSPTGTEAIVLGISINPETSQRAIDRGPPSDQPDAVKSFIELWGSKAQLRRFKDGAIVQAVVWNDTPGRFQNENQLNGGIIERIIRHIVQVHYTKEAIQVSLPDFASTVDGVVANNKNSIFFSDPFAAHRNIMKAFDSLSEFLKKNSQPPLPGSKGLSPLGLPLAIDAVEPLSPCLRYSELFPPIPHPCLGGANTNELKVSGAITSDPVLVQIRFGASSKWPTDLKAMAAAKAAMLIQIANGIEAMDSEGFEGRIVVTPTYAEVGYKGYCFRILVRADPEIRMLQGLQNPSPSASAMLRDLTLRHLVASMHHATIHGVHTLHPSAGGVVRLARRWLCSHMLSGLISLEAVELMVAKIYENSEYPLDEPGTVEAGFLRFLNLLACHDWAR